MQLHPAYSKGIPGHSPMRKFKKIVQFGSLWGTFLT